MTEVQKFIAETASSMEAAHYNSSTSLDIITEAYLESTLLESGRIDEGFVDVLKTIGRGISYPIEQVKNFWKHDRELVAEVAKAEKSFPKETIAAIYSMEFADTNIVEDLWDMLCMLKDVILFRYQHIPWRTAVSAAGLALYYFSPYNLTLGTAIVKWLESSGGGFAGNLFGDGNADAGAEAVATTPDGVAPGETVVDVTGNGNSVPNAGETYVDVEGPGGGTGSSLPTNNPNVDIADGHKVVHYDHYENLDTTTESQELDFKVGETVDLGNGTKAVCTKSEWSSAGTNGEWTYDYAEFDTNGDGVADMVSGVPDADSIQRMNAAHPVKANESVTALATGVAAAAGAGILYYHANKAKIIAGLKVAEPYLNYLDELLIVFLLWKWFKKDLRDYRKWLATKELVNDRKERGLNPTR